METIRHQDHYQEIPVLQGMVHPGFRVCALDDRWAHVEFGFHDQGKFIGVNFADEQSLLQAREMGITYILRPTSSGGATGKEPSIAKELEQLHGKPEETILQTILIDYAHSETYEPKNIVYFTQQSDGIYSHEASLTPDPHTKLETKFRLIKFRRPFGASGGIVDAKKIVPKFFQDTPSAVTH